MIVPAIALGFNIWVPYVNSRAKDVKSSTYLLAGVSSAIGITLSIAAIWTVYMKGCPKLFDSKHFESLPLAGRLIKKLPSLRYGTVAAATISNIAVFELSSLVFGLLFVVPTLIHREKEGRLPALERVVLLTLAMASLTAFLSFVYFRPIGVRHLSKLPLMNRVLSHLSVDLQELISRVGHLCLGTFTTTSAIFLAAANLPSSNKSAKDSKKKIDNKTEN